VRPWIFLYVVTKHWDCWKNRKKVIVTRILENTVNEDNFLHYRKFHCNLKSLLSLAWNIAECHWILRSPEIRIHPTSFSLSLETKNNHFTRINHRSHHQKSKLINQSKLKHHHNSSAFLNSLVSSSTNQFSILKHHSRSSFSPISVAFLVTWKINHNDLI
jgi:hypothetical protein